MHGRLAGAGKEDWDEFKWVHSLRSKCSRGVGEQRRERKTEELDFRCFARATQAI